MKQARRSAEPPEDGRIRALLSNANAVRAVAEAVEGTIGPKGLDTMLVDPHGQTVITNDGITILTLMEATHPAARLVVNAARAQEEQVGDGTTTTTILVSALVAAGVDRVAQGVPVTRVVEGMRLGIQRALEAMGQHVRPVAGLSDPVVRQVALVAGRGQVEIADLVLSGAALLGEGRLSSPALRLADLVQAGLQPSGEVFPGVLIHQERVDRDAPQEVSPVRVVILDDALDLEEPPPGALATDAGFQQYLAQRNRFLAGVRTLADLGVNLVLADRSVAGEALDLLTEAGVMVLQNVPLSEWRRAAAHTGARAVRRSALSRPAAELLRCLGSAHRAWEDERLGQVRITGGGGEATATLLVGAATPEVAAERERIAKDAAASLQAALRGGVLPGGGSVELHASRVVEQYAATVRGMAAHGVQAVAEALRRPLWQVVANAGFNPLEKLGDVVAAQGERRLASIAVDCDTGELADMWAAGVVDPAPVKLHAVRSAGEIAEAILRIDAILRMQGEE